MKFSKKNHRGENKLCSAALRAVGDKSFEKELNMFPVLWNIDPLDWCSHNADCIASKVVEKAGDGDIILMHDYYETSVTAALEVVDILQKRGFQFVTVEEILFD